MSRCRRRSKSGSLRRAAVVAAGLTILSAVALTGTACGAGAPSPNPSASPPRQVSGIRGIVLLAGGPYILSPSPLPAGFGSGRQGRPYPGVTVQVAVGRGLHRGRVIAIVRPDADALFTIVVPPGTYVLRPLVPRDGPGVLSTTVVVAPGKFVRALVYAVAR
jgi:hypothetical protein